MNVLIAGQGGREHALAWKVSASPMVDSTFCAPGNAGTAIDCENVALDIKDHDKVVSFCKDQDVELVVIGPEDPLVSGLVDHLTQSGIKAFGPTAAAAQLEGDKAFAKELLRQYTIPTAEGHIFTNYEEARAFIASRDEPLAIKASGLAQGKGVIVCDDPADALLAAEKIMVDKAFGRAGDKLIVEEKLAGREVSVLALVDGRNIYVVDPAQDFKRAGDGDTGPNTGGMGAYCPCPVVSGSMMEEIERQILVPIIDALNRRNIEYKGVLYAGLMITPTGPRVLEFNVRFGDPETQPILMRLKSDIVPALLGVCDGTLDQVNLEWDDRFSVCVVMASGGYPGKYEKGKEITGLDQVDEEDGDVKVFHAGTASDNDKIVTAGGRVLGVTALGDTIAQAREKAYESAEKINFDNAIYRKDIAEKAEKNTAAKTK